jgi:histidine triad (HIT) family protein
LCELVAGEAERSVVHEDQNCVVVMDIAPVNPGHALVIPRDHIPLISGLPEDAWLAMCSVARRIAAAIRTSGLRCEGMNLLLADGEVAFQEVPHVHLHVVPRFEGDSFKIDADWSQQPTREELDLAASMIAVQL